jgi:hypothetical protein
MQSAARSIGAKMDKPTDQPEISNHLCGGAKEPFRMTDERVSFQFADDQSSEAWESPHALSEQVQPPLSASLSPTPQN